MDVLIGSRAIKWHFPDFPREPKDIDYASTLYDKPYMDHGGFPVAEYYPIPPLTNRYHPFTRDMKVATPDELITLKLSHLFWDIKWEKTIFDFVWLQKAGAQIIWPLFWELYKHWETVHGVPKRADLNMSVEDFFTNGIKDGHNHDTLHTFVKNPPTYCKILKESDGVDIDEFKFFTDLTDEERLDIIREECYVMAYERMGESDYRDAYREQLKRWILVHAPTVNMACVAILNYDTLRKPLINYKEVIDYGRSKEADVR